MTTLLLERPEWTGSHDWRPGTEGVVVSRGAAMVLGREQEDASE